ncbi:hypothetical protein LOTGIDRAFT_109634 [Lottia gigantea]|uniref:Serpin domain-containing protein n=1 Tax=Lottia gigantea TaxID=225164 RepID=V4BBL0_LOTGI|nr:hypothetical protein LOTGIDRAFT_109634 [Lottia gigantea]ESP04951.1 hypothetical protein LOTGIDRAFT_109634 [Lottia gigantea]
MYQRLKSSSSNLIFSPISIFLSLSMTSLGARGSTKFQINRSLRQGNMKRFVHQASRILLSKMPESTGNITHQQANAIFVRRPIPIQNSFKTRVARYYETEIYNLSTWYPEREINHWVERRTDGLLSDFLSPGSLGDSFMMWIINAVFFRGTWAKIFDFRQTRQKSFTRESGMTTRVEMMEMIESFPSYRMENMQTSVLEIPYVGGQYSFFIFLPDTHNGLQRLESEMTHRLLESVMTNMEPPKRFSIQIPKLYLDNSLDLEGTLKEMGITKLFDANDANIAGISANNDLFVDSVIHKSVLEVNEFGTTAMTVNRVSVSVKTTVPQFIANRPFMFIVRNKKYKINMYMGRFAYP